MKKLTQIANQYGTDKGTKVYPYHGFTDIYDDILLNRANTITRVLEIGIDKGCSLRMWRDYFPNAQVYGLDYLKNQMFSENRITTFQANQSKTEDLSAFIAAHGSNFDLIVDDGGHSPAYQQISFGFLFRHLNSKGIFIIEDLHTSFMKEYIENTDDPNAAYRVLKRFEETGELTTPYIAPDDISYIKDNVLSIKIIDLKNDKQHITSIIEKK